MRVISKTAGWLIATEAYVYGRSGQIDKARETLARLGHIASAQRVNPVALFFASLGAGEQDTALQWLERAYAEHSNSTTSLKVDPAFDPLQHDPRFHELLGRVGLDK